MGNQTTPFVPPSGNGGNVALSATTPKTIGGLNQYRSGITVTSNDGVGQIVWLYWGDAVAPLAATVKAQGTPLFTTGSSVYFSYTLGGNGDGTVTPTLWGLADVSDQVSPGDTRYSEGG